MSGVIKSVEIFGVGTWTGSRKVTVTEAMLDEMVENFSTINAIPGFTPIVKLGHADAQKFFGNTSGAPNLGFISRIWREGKKLLADFSNIPDALLELIAKRRYNSLSIEIYPRMEHDGKTFSNVLTAVALLGAELPAVKGLKELASSLFADVFEHEGERLELKQENDMTFTQEQHDALVAAAVKVAVDAAVEKFADERTTLTAAKDAAEAAAVAEKARADKAIADAALAERAAFEAEVATVIDAAIAEGKIVPAQKDAATAFMLNMGKSVKFGDKEQSPTAIFKSFCDAMPKGVVKFGEQGNSTPAKDGSGGTAADEVHSKTNVALAASDGKLTYATAMQAVLTADPDLKARYAAKAE